MWSIIAMDWNMPNNSGDKLKIEKMKNKRHINDNSNQCADGNIIMFG
jgi:hypothetical protein